MNDIILTGILGDFMLYRVPQAAMNLAYFVYETANTHSHEIEMGSRAFAVSLIIVALALVFFTAISIYKGFFMILIGTNILYKTDNLYLSRKKIEYEKSLHKLLETKGALEQTTTNLQDQVHLLESKGGKLLSDLEKITKEKFDLEHSSEKILEHSRQLSSLRDQIEQTLKEKESVQKELQEDLKKTTLELKNLKKQEEDLLKIGIELIQKNQQMGQQLFQLQQEGIALQKIQESTVQKNIALQRAMEEGQQNMKSFFDALMQLQPLLVELKSVEGKIVENQDSILSLLAKMQDVGKKITPFKNGTAPLFGSSTPHLLEVAS